MIITNVGCRPLTSTVIRDFSNPGSPGFTGTVPGRDIRSTLVACEGCDITRSLLLFESSCGFLYSRGRRLTIVVGRDTVVSMPEK
jgi:hypothetical protein